MAPHWADTLLHEAFITHTFQIFCISTRDIRATHSVWCSVPKSAELPFPLAAGEIRLFSSPHVSQCLTYIRKKNESSTNPHPNSQTFLNPKQESQACDKKRYSCPHLSWIFLFFNFFFISFLSLCINISEQINDINNNLLFRNYKDMICHYSVRKQGISVVLFNTINLLNQL